VNIFVSLVWDCDPAIAVALRCEFIVFPTATLVLQNVDAVNFVCLQLRPGCCRRMVL
jgi:hypothetical protein